MSTHRLTVLPLDVTIDVAEEQTILEACLQGGVWLPYACGHGRCGTCKVTVTDGDVDHGDASPFALMDVERDENKTLACCARLRSDATIEADIEEEEDAENHVPRSVEAVVLASTPLTPTVRELRLRVPDDFAFQAGQYVNVHVPGVSPPRAFSIANAPGRAEHGVVALQVRRVDGGKATGWLHDELRVGQALRIDGPYGRFFVRRTRTAPRIFVAGGSGLSSLESMLLERAESGCTVPTTLVHGARSVAELYHREVFTELASRHPHVRYVPVVSSDEDALPDGVERGFAHEALERAFGGKFAGHTAYLCGPPAMVEASIRSLMKGRLFEKDIFTERFVTQGDGAEALAKSPLFKRI